MAFPCRVNFREMGHWGSAFCKGVNGMAGRPRKPTALRVIEGNRGKRPLPVNEPKPAPIAPACPTWLLADAKKEWRRLAPELENMGLLTRVDMAVLASYCQSFARWKQAEQALKKHGQIAITPNGFEQASAWETIAKQRHRDMLACAKEFGFTPASRAKVSVSKNDEEDEFAALLSR